jgi:hypothetical protein
VHILQRRCEQPEDAQRGPAESVWLHVGKISLKEPATGNIVSRYKISGTPSRLLSKIRLKVSYVGRL